MYRLRARQDASRKEQASTVPASFPAPVGGWNTRDALADMPVQDAIQLDNWIAKTESCITRGGSIPWATDNIEGLGEDHRVESLLPYEPAGGSRKLFAATDNGDVFDVTVAGSASTADLTGLTNGRWQSVNFANSGGTYLVAVNGADTLKYFNGTIWQSIATFTFEGGTIATSVFIHLNVFKQRMFFIRGANLGFYYNVAAGALTGEVAYYEARQLFTKGGYMVAMGTWTSDGGDGPDDRAAFLTSEGEVVVFAGTDPGEATAWDLVGVYFIGRPIGRRCFIKYGADLLLLTERGLFPLMKALSAEPEKMAATAVTTKIDSAFNDSARGLFSTFGWDVTVFPLQTLGIVNVPSTGRHIQYVWNLLTGAWSRFTDWEAYCFCVFNGELYFGHEGGVAKALTGSSDFDEAIQAPMMTAFNYFGTPGESKQVALIRPTFAANGAFGYLLGGNVDFNRDTPSGVIVPGGVVAAVWDTALWDVAVWPADYVVTRQWQTVFTWDGFCFSTFLKVASAQVTVQLLAFDYKILPGSGL